MENTDKLERLMVIVNKTHKEAFEKMSESEKKDLLFELDMAEHVWDKVKGYPIPDCYSVEDRIGILQRYWHRAIEKE